MKHKANVLAVAFPEPPSQSQPFQPVGLADQIGKPPIQPRDNRKSWILPVVMLSNTKKSFSAQTILDEMKGVESLKTLREALEERAANDKTGT
ncbi:hypothetical protein [Marinobacter vinifirmus]|uniref:Uncharacterized protein n=1 Tax=Marinobacter vinifirmus TaxID=355591 RepID=A0A558B3D4_9GAMM|nr:hypothetical protein [Marinobacter vinifirmus]TVT31022.1 MAG: hypothetical protein FHK81_15765 [Marinobacter vinifirmus]